MDYIIRYENISLGSIHSVGSRLFIYLERTFLFITLNYAKTLKTKRKHGKYIKNEHSCIMRNQGLGFISQSIFPMLE